MKPTISIIIPALNEEGNIEDTVNTVRLLCRIDSEIVNYLFLMTEALIEQDNSR